MGTDRRERMSSFLEPLELEDIDPLPRAAEEQPISDRITAVPDEKHAALVKATKEQDADPVSGLHERTEPGMGAPPPPAAVPAPPQPEARDELPSDLPPVLGATADTKRPPRRQASAQPVHVPARPVLESPRVLIPVETPVPPATVPSPPPFSPRGEVELELADVDRDSTPGAFGPPLEPDALEVELPTRSLEGHRLPSLPVQPDDPALIDMRDRYATGDFSGSLVVAEAILAESPDHEEALRCRERCTDVLSQMYLARLGSLKQIIRVAVAREQIRWLSLDHRAGFLLSLIDGTSSIDELLDVSSMPRLEALRILYGLLDQRVIELSN